MSGYDTQLTGTMPTSERNPRHYNTYVVKGTTPIMNKTTLIKTLIQNSGSTIISVEFQKKDGNTRKIQFNPRDRQEIKGFSGSTTTNDNIIRIRDFAIAKKKRTGAWRSFDCSRVVNITTNGQKISF